MTDRGGIRNVGVFPFDDKIKNDVAEITEGDDVEDMLTGICSLISDIGAELANKMELTGKDRDFFDEVHDVSENELRKIIYDRWDKEVSPDTVRAHLISVVIPLLIENGLVPFREQNADKEREAVVPYISSLRDAANAAIGTIDDPGLALKAETALRTAKQMIDQTIKRN
ncbi:MAG: hypothetical protein G01um10148_971 [Parcubacteria group bacterium Gr01-1014_8]|nr:MAG: hypothetical protein G01um10148_971 [Parcubacteria group bacterium Gr01-1014_8]